MTTQRYSIYVTFFCFLFTATASSRAEIPLQRFDMKPPASGEARVEPVLPGEVAEVETHHVALTGPLEHEEPLSSEQDTVLLVIKGKGVLRLAETEHALDSETIVFVPDASRRVAFHLSEGETLHYLRVRKLLSPDDRRDAASFPTRKTAYIKKFTECEAYKEAIKSPKTTSRTVLPQDHVPRVAMGTVETRGPDAVGAHEHPMLDQLFLGLADNNTIVQADDETADFPEFSLLHIPLGSSHGMQVADGNRMYYMWMDFFITKEGQEWLKTHKSLDDDDDDD